MCEGQEYEKLLKEVNKKVEELQVSINLANYFVRMAFYQLNYFWVTY